MSTNLVTIPLERGDVQLTSFHGGRDRGPMLQLTVGSGYVQASPVLMQEVLTALLQGVDDYIEEVEG